MYACIHIYTNGRDLMHCNYHRSGKNYFMKLKVLAKRSARFLPVYSYKENFYFKSLRF